MMAANYQHIGGHENRLGRHYSRFSAFWPPAALTDQSLALRKSQNAGSNGRSRARQGIWHFRDEFAADSPLHRRVICEPDFLDQGADRHLLTMTSSSVSGGGGAPRL